MNNSTPSCSIFSYGEMSRRANLVSTDTSVVLPPQDVNESRSTAAWPPVLWICCIASGVRSICMGYLSDREPSSGMSVQRRFLIRVSLFTYDALNPDEVQSLPITSASVSDCCGRPRWPDGPSPRFRPGPPSPGKGIPAAPGPDSPTPYRVA
jgi:hypothetical protein